MTDAEKLRRLIEIAWDNGFPGKPAFPWHLKFYDGGFRVEDNANDWCAYLTKSVPELLFDHEFIKALCSSRPEPRTMDSIVNPFDSDEFEPWQYHSCRLALSTDRIGYLWKEFGQ
jgi:hypothetical protein